MSKETTPVIWNKKVGRIRNMLDMLIAASPHLSEVSLTPESYRIYWEAVVPHEKIAGLVNPKYKGVVLKKKEIPTG
jgi:hypothetical protein